MTRQVVPHVDADGEVVMKPSIVKVQAKTIFDRYTVVRFNNRPMYLVEDGFEHYIPLTKERFDNIAYNMLNGPTRGRVSDVFAEVINTAEDLSHNSHLILFGRRELLPNDTYRPLVWASDTLSPTAYEPDQCVWRSPFAPIKTTDEDGKALNTEPVEFIMQLAGGDEGLYGDIMQSIAPIIMDKKPDGVVWWIGDGANGKSTLMDALYRIFPGQLASLTVKALTDGRDTPNLNGNLANIVKESSEGRVDDTEIYKSIGTHENLTVHKFHSQETVTIVGNMHHIFSGNSIPVFNDKGFSARRRTFIIPFDQKFESDPTFEDKLFTPQFFGQLIAEMFVYAKQLRDQGYRYKWSARTLGAKLEYDTEANTAENYANELVAEGVVGFDNFGSVRNDYENWCREEGQVPLGVGNMRRAIQDAGFQRLTVRTEGHTTKAYRLATARESELEKLSMARPGLYTMPGFQPKKPVETPNFAPEDVIPSIIGNKW